LHRVWSTDWFRHPEAALKKLVEAVEKARLMAHQKEEEEDEALVVDTAVLREEVAAGPDQLPPYVTAHLPASVGEKDLHQYPVGKLAQWVEAVVETEGPVHTEEVARRIAEAAGVSRVGTRMKQHLALATQFAEGGGRIRREGEFLWHPGNRAALRDRSGLPASSRKLRYIAPEELDLAIVKVVGEAVAIHPEAAFPYIARVLGFTRVTEDMRTELLERIGEGVKRGVIRRENGMLRLPG
ncbi:MAG TPA: DUF3320 domain-containing protein, partial [Chitinophagaceae bacterium]|nr:DUF3320 domain-containing protein [Chitinophagaceae bacterium]